MPPWVQEGGYEAWRARLQDPALRPRIAAEMREPSEEWESLLLAAGSAEKVLLVGFKNERLKPYTGQTLAAVPALFPDVTLLHVSRADRFGNCQIDGYPHMDADIGRAATTVLVTTEELVPEAEIRRRPDRTVIPGFVVDALVHVPFSFDHAGSQVIFFSPERMAMFREWLDEGFRAAPGRDRSRFDIMPGVAVKVGNDVAACRAAMKPRLALYVGGMGARGKNFYNEIARRYGYEDAAKRIQDLYLGGRKDEAAAAVPDALVDEVALCGPRERIREQLAEWTASGVTTIMVSGDSTAVRTMAELAL